jgi:hypothetical protein
MLPYDNPDIDLFEIVAGTFGDGRRPTGYRPVHEEDENIKEDTASKLLTDKQPVREYFAMEEPSVLTNSTYEGPMGTFSTDSLSRMTIHPSNDYIYPRIPTCPYKRISPARYVAKSRREYPSESCSCKQKPKPFLLIDLRAFIVVVLLVLALVAVLIAMAYKVGKRGGVASISLGTSV